MLRFRILACGLMAMAGAVHADTIVGATFFSGGAAPSETGATYWDNLSTDGSKKNAGYFLTGTGGFAGNGAYVSGLSWAGATYATALQSLTFTPSGTMELLRVLGNFSGNSVEVGIYDATQATAAGALASVIPLVSTDGTGTKAGFTTTFKSPWATYGFYLRYTNKVGGVFVPSNGDVYMSQTANSTGAEIANTAITGVSVAAPHQHFAVFQSAGALGAPSPSSIVNYIAVEDGWGAIGFEKTGDFNDLIFSVADIPEPATFGFMALGLAALVVARRRRS